MIVFILLNLLLFLNSCTTERERYKKLSKDGFIYIQVVNEKDNPVYNATVYLNGLEKDLTDFYGISIIKANKGKNDVKIVKNGYESYSKSIYLREKRYDLKLVLYSFDYYKNKLIMLLNEKKYDEAEKLFKNKIKNIEISKEIKDYLQVLLYYKQKKYNDAIIKLKQMLNNYKNDVYILTLAKIYEQNGQYKDAIDRYMILIKIDELKYYFVYKNIGLIYLKNLSNYKEGKKFLTKYLEFCDDDEIKSIIGNN